MENTDQSSRGGTLMALAAGSLSFAKVHAHDVETLEETEQCLEKEICHENRAPPKGSVAKIRRHGERFLHSKQVLLAVVILNIIDCILVMGELIFDIHYIVDVLEKSETMSNNFIDRMEAKYPNEMIKVNDISQLYEMLLHSSIHWNTSTDSPVALYHMANGSNVLNLGHNDNHFRQKRAASQNAFSSHENQSSKKHKKEHTIEEDIAHGFHKASITILAILVIETGCKMFCFGRHMLENKLEVFDSFIVFASFILDLVFIKGITLYSIQEFVFILAFLVPWRVLRVVNSLMVAIIDHEHFRMKLLYKQKKQILIQLKDTKKEVKRYEKSIQCLEQLCSSAGISEFKVRCCTANLKSRKKKVTGSFDYLSKFASAESDEITPMIQDDGKKNGTVQFMKKSYSYEDLF